MRQVLRAGALGRPRGMGWRGRREGGWGWGIHVNPWLIHVNVWQKPLQCCKVISQLIKINGEKKRQKRLKVLIKSPPMSWEIYMQYIKKKHRIKNSTYMKLHLYEKTAKKNGEN